jgi:hypothetical protein
MNIRMKIIYFVHKVYLCTPLIPSNFIWKFFLFCFCETNIYLTKHKNDVRLRISMQILPTEWKVEAVFRDRRNTAATNSVHIQRFGFSCNWHNNHSGGRDSAQQVIIVCSCGTARQHVPQPYLLTASRTWNCVHWFEHPYLEQTYLLNQLSTIKLVS